MESFISMEFLLSVDALICMVSGVVLGLLVTQFMPRWSMGMVGNLLTGLVGGLFGGLLFNWLDVLNVGDYADPVIAGVIGAVFLLAIAGAVRRERKASWTTGTSS